jgi:hypothetical protein
MLPEKVDERLLTGSTETFPRKNIFRNFQLMTSVPNNYITALNIHEVDRKFWTDLIARLISSSLSTNVSDKLID